MSYKKQHAYLGCEGASKNSQITFGLSDNVYDCMGKSIQAKARRLCKRFNSF